MKFQLGGETTPMADDETLLMQFEAATWPLQQWHHRQHIKVAYLYLRQHPFEVAVQKMRAGLLAYNTTNDVPDSLDRGYHETMTQVWMRLVDHTLCEFGPSESADAFVDEHTQLLSKRAILYFYSRDRIMSAEAKRRFIAPDLAPLPQSAGNRDAALQERNSERRQGAAPASGAPRGRRR